MNTTMIIASFDVGRKNLACVILTVRQGPTVEVLKMHNMDLGTCKSTTEYVTSLHETLNRLEDAWAGVTQVLIESQMGDNSQMKSLSHCIQMYFLHRNKQIKFCSPGNKLKVFQKELPEETLKLPKDAYRKKKKLAELRAAHFFSDNSVALNEFNSHPKKDDIADALLQALHFIHAKFSVRSVQAKNVPLQLRPAKKVLKTCDLDHGSGTFETFPVVVECVEIGHTTIECRGTPQRQETV